MRRWRPTPQRPLVFRAVFRARPAFRLVLALPAQLPARLRRARLHRLGLHRLDPQRLDPQRLDLQLLDPLRKPARLPRRQIARLPALPRARAWGLAHRRRRS